ncbi:MAG: tape measure protein [Pseudomonadota bacterium]
MNDFATLRVKVTSDGITIAGRELDQLARSAGEAEQRVSAFSRANTTVDRLTRSMQGLGAALSALGLGAAMTQVIRATDQYAAMRGQLALVTESQEQLNSTYERSLRLANETGQSTETTVSLYARLARSTEELNLSQNQLFTITEAVNQSFVVSGASAQESSSAILQLSQGLAAGALRGEELNSVMENSPRLARALADGLGVSIGQLRSLGQEGQLTAERVTGALLSTADSINDEFEQMPMTVGRATQRVRNLVGDMFGTVDAEPVMEAVEEFEELIADEGFQRSITSVTEGLISMATGFARALDSGTRLSRFIGEELSRRLNGTALDDIPGMTRELEKLESRLENKLWMWAATDERIAEVSERAEFLRVALSRAAAEMRETSDTGDRLARATDDVASAAEEAEDEVDNLAVSLGQVATVGFAGADGMLTFAAASQQVAQDNIEAKLALVATREELDGPFDQALQNVVERIDTEFASAWRGAFDSFDDFADGIKSALEQLLAELAHMAITRPIIMQLGAAVGLGGASSAAMAGAGGLGAGGISGALSSLGGPLMSGLTGLEGFAASQGLTGTANFLYGAQSGFAQTGALVGGGAAAGAALTGGAGLLGSLLANQLFGGGVGTSIGSAFGGVGGGVVGASALTGILGAAGGPVGAIVGALLGGGLGSVFGNDQPSDRTGTALLNASTGQITIGGLDGKKFSQENRDSAAALAETFAQFAASIGGSSAVLDIGVGSRDGLRLDGKDYGEDIAGFLDAGFSKILAEADDLSGALSIDGVSAAVDAFERLNDESATMTGAFDNASQAMRDVIQGYDGSAESVMQLSQALSVTEQMAFQLAGAIIDAQRQIDSLTGDSAQRIRDSVLTDEERFAVTIERRDTLAEELENLADPAKILEAVREIERLNEEAFRLLGDATPQQADQFAGFIEQINDAAQSQLDNALLSLESRQEQINEELGRVLTAGAGDMANAAATQANAAARFASAVATFAAVAADFGRGGGEINA